MNDALPDGTLGVVFTDIEGSTKLLRALGDRFDAVLARHHELMREAIAAGGGVEVQTDGDAFFVLFERPADAVGACVAAQRALAAEPWPDDGVIRVRMGIHLGEVRRGGDNYTGLGVHQGARVASAGHGGQVIVSAAAAAALGHALSEGIGLVDLGPFHLRDFDGPQRLFQVLHPDLERSFPPPRLPSAAVHNLAPPRTSFVGRSAELNELVKAIDVMALVTVVGPGGVGKTRLASEVGLQVAGRFPQGVWLVPLASIEGSDAVVEHVKAAMGLVDRPGLSTTEVIAERLASGPGLIILDNCEHVLDGCVELVEALLDASETTTILATSREHLGVMGEAVIRLGPLDLPGDTDAHFGPAGAVELFVARGAQARRGFALSDNNAAVIESICRRLDGIPLGLELAAARLSTMGLSQLHQRLEDALGVLGSGRRGGYDRQRTLRATLEWSYRLLSPDDQAVFKALSVFRSDFTLDAAEAVVDRDASGADVVAESLERLVAQSLVELETVAEPPRYRLLQTTRAYGAEGLDSTDARMLADRHAAYYAGVAHACAEEGATPYTLGRLADCHPDLLGALEHLAGCDRPTDHGRLVVDLAEFWDVRGHWQLARQQHLAYLSLTGRDRALDGHVLGHLGEVASRLGDYPEGRARYEEALVISRQLGDRGTEGYSVGGLGDIGFVLGDYPEARARYEEALGIARELGDRRSEGRWVGNLGQVSFALGDYAEARARLEEALAIARQLGDRRSEGRWVGNLGQVSFVLGDHPEARARYEEALGIARQLGDRSGEGRWAGSLGQVSFALGEYPEARARLEEALGIARQLGDRRLEGYWVGNLGGGASALGDYPEARGRYEEALGIARQLGDRSVEGSCVGNLGRVAAALGDYPEARGRYEEALGIARQLGDRRLEARWVGDLGAVAFALGDSHEARVLYEEALVIARERGEPARHLLESCAELLARSDHCDEAAELLAAADNLSTVTRRPASDELRYRATLAVCRDRLDDAAFASASKRGGALGWPSAADTALRVLRHL